MVGITFVNLLLIECDGSFRTNDEHRNEARTAMPSSVVHVARLVIQVMVQDLREANPAASHVK